jgi:membrane protein DedA with SNARE-associated domain
MTPLLLWSWIGPAAADQSVTGGAPPGTAQPNTAAPGPAASGTLRGRIAADLERDVARVQPWLDRYGYAAVGVAVGLEGAGLPTPGQTLLSVAALNAVANPGLRIGWVVLAAFVGSVLGNGLGYLIGRWGGRALLARLRVNEARLARVDAGFARWGGWLIVFGRFVDGPRQLLSIAAGILEMPWPRFVLFTLLGAALWAGFWGLGVYYLDEHFAAVVALIRKVNPWAALATLGGLVGLIVAVWWRLARQKSAAA